MKHWIKFIVTAVFALIVMPIAAAASEGGSGILTAENGSVSLALNLPEGQTETITSLRLKLLVSVESGTISEPGFQFESSVKSAIKDAAISRGADGNYQVDIVLSGNKDQNIFYENAYAKIGTLMVQPASKEYKVKVEIAGEGGEPVVTYMDAGGTGEMKAMLASAEAAVLESTGAPAVNPAFYKKPILKAAVKKGTNSVIFEWKKIAGADGYMLYQYQAKTKKYKSVKTVDNPAVTAYSAKFSYAVTHSFKMRAYRIAGDGGKEYGPYSSVMKVTLPPKKVKSLSVKSKDAQAATLSWKKVSGAKGYQIYRSKKKKGKYKLLKTIKKGTTKKYSVKKPTGSATYYYKVRAYVTGPKGKHAYGKFGPVKSLRANP